MRRTIRNATHCFFFFFVFVLRQVLEWPPAQRCGGSPRSWSALALSQRQRGKSGCMQMHLLRFPLTRLPSDFLAHSICQLDRWQLYTASHHRLLQGDHKLPEQPGNGAMRHCLCHCHSVCAYVWSRGPCLTATTRHKKTDLRCLRARTRAPSGPGHGVTPAPTA